MRDGFIDCGDGEVEVGVDLMGCRWLGGGLGALAFHPFLAFAESDEVSMTYLALALHQIPRFV